MSDICAVQNLPIAFGDCNLSVATDESFEHPSVATDDSCDDSTIAIVDRKSSVTTDEFASNV